MLTIEELLVLHVSSTESPTAFVLEAVASVAQSYPQYHRVNLEAVEQDRIAHIPLTRPCLRMQSEKSVPAPATTQHHLMHITCPRLPAYGHDLDVPSPSWSSVTGI